MRFVLYKFLLFALICFLGITLSYAWQLNTVSQHKLVNAGVSFYEFAAIEKKTFPILVDVVVLKNNQYHAGLFIQREDNIQSTLDIASYNNAFLATNGGYYREGFLVNGLLIDQGKLRLGLVENSLLSSIITIDKNGQISILDKDQNYKNAYYAFQAGPVLMKNNEIQKVENTRISKRVIYAETTNNHLMVFFIDSATLQQSANVIKAITAQLNFHVTRAVNFDGGIAAAFVLRQIVTPIIYPEYVPVKSVVYFKLTENEIGKN